MTSNDQSKAVVKHDDGCVRFLCPGCKQSHRITVKPVHPEGWEWNGSLDRPTISPSILAQWTGWVPPVTSENHEAFQREPWPQSPKEYVCHSYVRDGQIQFLGDCTHELANQTVPLNPIE